MGRPAAGQGGFTLIETLVAMIVLVFGLIAVTNLLLVAAASNSTANATTAATNIASKALEERRVLDYGMLVSGTTTTDDDVPGVGRIQTVVVITPVATGLVGAPGGLLIDVTSTPVGALTGARARAHFTMFRSCTAVGC
jgi:prepilin-type N-terminal cleavage/methylation domain-containing protein